MDLLVENCRKTVDRLYEIGPGVDEEVEAGLRARIGVAEAKLHSLKSYVLFIGVSFWLLTLGMILVEGSVGVHEWLALTLFLGPPVALWMFKDG